MAGYLKQIRNLANLYACPVVCAGDLFDDGWRTHRIPPELINFAITHLPELYAVPGQHDLPHHNYTDIKKSAYWTLVEAGKVVNLSPKEPLIGAWDQPVCLWGFPWGFHPTPCPRKKEDKLTHVAVIHSYVWKDGHSHPGAPEDKHVDAYMPALEGYHAAAFGDNHKGFLYGGRILNCGTLMRRRSDERNYKPHVGLLRADRTISLHYLECGEDKFADLDEKVEQNSEECVINITEFVEELEALGDRGMEFGEVVLRTIKNDKVRDGVRKVVIKALEGKRKK